MSKYIFTRRANHHWKQGIFTQHGQIDLILTCQIPQHKVLVMEKYLCSEMDKFCAMSLPGHSTDNMAYYVPEKSLVIAGLLIPRADRPTRWDMPTGCLPDLIVTLQRLKRMNLDTIIPLQGPAIKGKQHVSKVISRHIEFFQECATRDGKAPKSWARPAQTALWLTPHPPWPLEEREEIN